ncbi:hypothetical protein D9758_017623 [Tetrapyrgos nigripes]|uniref:Uncharacterized protein n=1 Tax=Tetrapyrgos nigripes TaxID=182062 RepID=A0A8H5CHP4_9AGAR|nr:hypothetical protein D9758_017623 [Tetrapyrgos nigripes]
MTLSEVLTYALRHLTESTEFRLSPKVAALSAIRASSLLPAGHSEGSLRMHEGDHRLAPRRASLLLQSSFLLLGTRMRFGVFPFRLPVKHRNSLDDSFDDLPALEPLQNEEHLHAVQVTDRDTQGRAVFMD